MKLNIPVNKKSEEKEKYDKEVGESELEKKSVKKGFSWIELCNKVLQYAKSKNITLWSCIVSRNNKLNQVLG